MQNFDFGLGWDAVPVKDNQPNVYFSYCFSYSSHQQKSWADKFPAQPPVESWFKPHHSLDIFTEAVHTWSEHEKLQE